MISSSIASVKWHFSEYQRERFGPNKLLSLILALLAFTFTCSAHAQEAAALQSTTAVRTVTGTRGLVAFWDFVNREPEPPHRFTAHVPLGQSNHYPLDVANYIKDYWGTGRAATYADFPQLGRGPFGNAIRIAKETDPDFRPFLFVPRSRLHDTPLDIKGSGKSVSYRLGHS